MCLAIPLRVVSIKAPVAVAEVGGVERPVNIMLLDKVEIGDYVLVHAGFAIQKIDPAEAKKTLELIREISG